MSSLSMDTGRMSVPCGSTAFVQPQRNVGRVDKDSEEGFVTLFNGKDLSGWEYGSVPPVKNPPPREKLEGKDQSSDGVFSVKDGLLVANGKKIRALYTAKEYNKDFHLKFEFRASADKPKDNSGLFIRLPASCKLDATNLPGSLTGVFRNVKTFHVGGWNEIDVTVTGNEANGLCNGEPIMKKPMKIPATGTIGLQSEYTASSSFAAFGSRRRREKWRTMRCFPVTERRACITPASTRSQKLEVFVRPASCRGYKAKAGDHFAVLQARKTTSRHAKHWRKLQPRATCSANAMI